MTPQQIIPSRLDEGSVGELVAAAAADAAVDYEPGEEEFFWPSAPQRRGSNLSWFLENAASEQGADDSHGQCDTQPVT